MAPSTEPVVEKAQHEPHCPWFLIGVTAPSLFQSIVAGISVIWRASPFFSYGPLYPRSLLYSEWDQSAMKLIPTVDL